MNSDFDMIPEIAAKRNRSQLFVTLVLVLILASLIGGYIYYGMHKAAEVPVAEDQTVPVDTEGLSQDEKADILKALNESPSTNLSPEEKAKTLKSLETSAVENSLTDEEKAKILEKLAE